MHNKREKHFADRSVQGAVLLRLALHWALFLLVAACFVYLVELLVGDPRQAGRHFVSRHGPTVLAVVVLAPIFLRDLCKLTNRCIGPMVRLRRAMRELAEGSDVAPIHFREHDYWKDLAADFNRVVERTQSAQPATEQSLATSDVERGEDA